MWKRKIFPLPGTENDVKAAVGQNLEDGWTVYKPSKDYKIPFQTLLRKSLLISPKTTEVPILK